MLAAYRAGFSVRALSIDTRVGKLNQIVQEGPNRRASDPVSSEQGLLGVVCVDEKATIGTRFNAEDLFLPKLLNN